MSTDVPVVLLDAIYQATMNTAKFKGLVKKYWGEGVEGGSEQRGGGSSVFEPLVRGVLFNFQLPLRGGSSCFFCFFLWELTHI